MKTGRAHKTGAHKRGTKFHFETRNVGARLLALGFALCAAGTSNPQAAFGNSTGDQQMLEYTGAGNGARLMMLVHHDDAKREYAYGAESKIGTFSDALHG